MVSFSLLPPPQYSWRANLGILQNVKWELRSEIPAMVDDPQTPINRRAENDGKCSASLDRNGPARSPFAVSRRPVIPSPRACLAVPSLDLSPSLPRGRGRRRWRDGVGLLRRASSLPRRPAPLEWVLPIFRGELSGKICSLGATFANPWGDDDSEGGAGCRGMRGRERV